MWVLPIPSQRCFFCFRSEISIGVGILPDALFFCAWLLFFDQNKLKPVEIASELITKSVVTCNFAIVPKANHTGEKSGHVFLILIPYTKSVFYYLGTLR